MGKLLIHIEYFEEYSEFSPQMREYLRRPLTYRYDDETTLGDMLNWICQSAPQNPHSGYESWSIAERFQLIWGDTRRDFGDENANLHILLNYIGEVNGEITLLLQEGRLGGGASVGRIDGVIYEFHPSEYEHRGRPHVHLRYGEHRASLDLLTLEVIVGELPKNKLKQALRVIRYKNNLGFLINKWNEVTVGFAIDPEGYYFDPKQKKLEPVEIG